MSLTQEYRDNIRTCVDTVRKRSAVAIFGASKAGWYTMKVLEAHGIPVAAFIDNDPQKQGNNFHGRPVVALQTAKTELQNATVLIALFRGRSSQQIQEQLISEGFNAPLHDTYAFLFSYFVDIAGRTCNHDLLADSINKLSAYYNAQDGYVYGHVNDGLFVSPFVTSVVTQCCTLRCHDCGQRIPDYTTPRHFPPDDVIREIERYCSAFDLVPEVSIHGGEPFLHPEVGRICQGISKIPNLVFINLITNGTIVPTYGTLHMLAMAGTDMHQSNYGKYSKHRNDVLLACAEHGIYCDTRYADPHERWSRIPPIRAHHRPIHENDQIYRSCMATDICCQVMDGNLYRCPIAAHGSAQGLIPHDEANVVRLVGPTSTIRLQSQIRRFLTRTSAIPVCDYCDPTEAIFVKPAIQRSKKHRTALKAGQQP